MKLEIEIPEEDAACVWSNQWGEKKDLNLVELVQGLVATEATRYRQAFPDAVTRALEDFRKIRGAEGATFLVVDAGVRYWEDAKINGVVDEYGTLTPCRNGNRWTPVIDLETGIIRDWPESTIADFHFKVCDDGEYWIANSAGVKLFKYADHYVPDDLLCVGDQGYGDYIILSIEGNGQITGWRRPTLERCDWRALKDGAALPFTK